MTAELPFAPRRKRPLSLLNPLDYLVLLYWVFFFPQALRWYMERFGTAPPDAKILTVLRQDQLQRRLVLQALLLLGFVALGLSLVLPMFGITPNLVSVAFVGVLFGVAGDVATVISFLRFDAFVLALLPAWLPGSKQLAFIGVRDFRQYFLAVGEYVPERFLYAYSLDQIFH